MQIKPLVKNVIYLAVVLIISHFNWRRWAYGVTDIVDNYDVGFGVFAALLNLPGEIIFRIIGFKPTEPVSRYYEYSAFLVCSTILLNVLIYWGLFNASKLRKRKCI